MLNELKMFFGFTSSTHKEITWLSWQHIVFCSSVVLIATLLGVLIGLKKRDKSEKEKIKVVRVAAILIVGFEIFKIAMYCWKEHDIMEIRGNLPLFLCSILLFSLPLAGFGKGRIREAATDFSLSFGVVCMIAGTFLAGNFFPSSLLKFNILVSVLTHCISGFSAVYIGVSRLATMKKKNLWISAMILLAFELLAFSVDMLQFNSSYQHNYMFFSKADGTPFSILENWAGGNLTSEDGRHWLYPIFVALVYFAYLALFDCGYYLIKALSKKSGAETK